MSRDRLCRAAGLASVLLCVARGRLAVGQDRATEGPAVQASPSPEPEKTAADPFAFADFSWVPGNYAAAERPLSTKAFTGEFRVDTAYHLSFNHPQDDTISGSSEVFRHGEFQLTQLGIGGDLSYKNVQGRLMTQFGMYSQTTPRNDPSPARGQWNLDGAYRYISEAYARTRWATRTARDSTPTTASWSSITRSREA